MPLKCTLKNGQNGKFYVLHVLPQLKRPEQVVAISGRFLSHFRLIFVRSRWVWVPLCAKSPDVIFSLVLSLSVGVEWVDRCRVSWVMGDTREMHPIPFNFILPE